MKEKKGIKVEHLKGSGPGGQNRNKRFSGVRVTDLQTGIAVRSTERRSQAQNLSNAMERLEDKLQSLSRPKKRRKPTKPNRAAKISRLESKRKWSAKKKERRHQNWD